MRNASTGRPHARLGWQVSKHCNRQAAPLQPLTCVMSMVTRQAASSVPKSGPGSGYLARTAAAPWQPPGRVRQGRCRSTHPSLQPAPQCLQPASLQAAQPARVAAERAARVHQALECTLASPAAACARQSEAVTVSISGRPGKGYSATWITLGARLRQYFLPCLPLHCHYNKCIGGKAKLSTQVPHLLLFQEITSPP